MEALRRHINNTELCKIGFIILRDIVLNGKTFTSSQSLKQVSFIYISEDNERRAGEPWAIGSIIRVMNKHIVNRNICENGCYILKMISLNGIITIYKNPNTWRTQRTTKQK